MLRANQIRNCLVALTIAAIASQTNTAHGCLGCYRPPYRSLLEKIEASDHVIVARADDATGAKVIRIIKGDAVELDQIVSVNKANSNQNFAGELQLLRRSIINDDWDLESSLDRQLLGFLTLAVQLSPNAAAQKTLRDQTEYFRFFLPYLEHADREIADSAYAKLAGAPYAVLRALGKQLKPAQLKSWIESPQIAQKRKSLYITLLGVCGGQAESQLVKQWIDRGWQNQNTDNLAALLVADAELNGEPAIRLIENAYLQNRERQLGELIAAVNALRVHGQADGKISRDRIKTSFQLLLRERPQLVELIIEDCARWKDWSVAAKLMEIHAGGQQPWNNAMILKYLQACPLPEAKRFVTRVSATDARAK
ncbi:MAG: hypothetical protein OES79_01885 [Planctomycetota bacterium]|nr:hypothetical protein [Planctomycetota bacterium]